jgi:hypothetical protein
LARPRFTCANRRLHRRHSFTRLLTLPRCAAWRRTVGQRHLERSGPLDAQRCGSAAPESRSIAYAVRRQLQPVVGRLGAHGTESRAPRPLVAPQKKSYSARSVPRCSAPRAILISLFLYPVASYYRAPPSTRMLCPVTHRASSLTRKATTSAISGGCPIRPIGVRWMSMALNSGECSRIPSSMSVSVGPANTALTVMPRGPSSFAHTRVNCSSADLLPE